jgi:hypothetical protein
MIIINENLRVAVSNVTVNGEKLQRLYVNGVKHADYNNTEDLIVALLEIL